MGIERIAKTLIVLALGITVMVTSCTKPSLVGAGIFPEEDFTNLGFTDTISMITSTEMGDSVRVYSPDQNQQLGNYLCGVVNDPIFGISSSQIYNQFILTRTNPDFSNVFSVDSLVFRLALNTDSLTYNGDISQPQSFNVYQLSEDMDNLEEYYSNQTFMAGNLIGSVNGYFPNISDSTTIDVWGTDSLGNNVIETEKLAPHMSFVLDQALADDMVYNADDSTFTGNTNFRNYFKGINIVPDPSNTALLRFNYQSEVSEMVLYYSEGNDPDSLIHRTFTFAINTLTAKTVNFNHDIGGTPVADAIAGTSISDSLVYVQGMEGPNAKISFPYAESLDNIIVNNAELILTVAEPMVDTVLYPLPSYLIATQLLDGIGFVTLGDVTSSGVILNSFGGNYSNVMENGIEYRRYRLNISKHFQEIIDGTAEYPDIYLSVFNKAELSNRVVLGGGNSSEYQAKLNLTYTKLE